MGTDEHPFTPSPSPLPPSLPSHHRRFDGCTQDTKPHRQIPLSLIIDALEYDLPPHRNHPTATSPPPASPQAALLAATAAAAVAPDDGDGAGTRTHTFKVVTTKRTLLLCAPSEEEEIKWLSAIRALIARRSGQGVVPGEPQSASVSSPAGAAAAGGAGAAAGGAAGAAGTTAPSSPSPIHKRRDSIVRRLSLSGGGSPFIGGGSAASAGAGAGVSSSTVTAASPGVQREGSSERQS